jgi:hypothetical protein
MTIVIPVDRDGHAYLCPWPSCREQLHIKTEGWEAIGPDTVPEGRMPDGETWSVECGSGHVIWTQADEAALDGGDTSEPDSPYNHARVDDVLQRIVDALADLKFTERCAWCGTATAVILGEAFDGSTVRDPACIACARERKLIAVRTLHPQTLAEREAEQVMPA